MESPSLHQPFTRSLSLSPSPSPSPSPSLSCEANMTNVCDVDGTSSLCITSEVAFWTLIGLNIVLLLFAMSSFLSTLTNPIWKITKIIKLLIPFVPIFRILNLIQIGSGYFVSGGPYSSNQTPSQVVTGSLVGYIVISIFTLLAIFWVLLYTMAYDGKRLIIATMKKVSMALNVCIYAVWAALMVCLYQFPCYIADIHEAEACYAAAINLVVSVTFLLFGNLLHRRLSNLALVSPTSLTIANRIGLLTIICVCVFIIRSALLFMDVFLFQTVVEYFVSTVIFDFGCETLPIFLILYILSSDLEENSERDDSDPSSDIIISREDAPLYERDSRIQ